MLGYGSSPCSEMDVQPERATSSQPIFASQSQPTPPANPRTQVKFADPIDVRFDFYFGLLYHLITVEFDRIPHDGRAVGHAVVAHPVAVGLSDRSASTYLPSTTTTRSPFSAANADVHSDLRPIFTAGALHGLSTNDLHAEFVRFR